MTEISKEVKKYLKEGMLFGNGLKIDITYRKGEQIFNERTFITDEEINNYKEPYLLEKIKYLVFMIFKVINK